MGWGLAENRDSGSWSDYWLVLRPKLPAFAAMACRMQDPHRPIGVWLFEIPCQPSGQCQWIATQDEDQQMQLRATTDILIFGTVVMEADTGSVD